MTLDKLHHGGDLNWARTTFTYEGEDWLDLSTGINPTPYPLPPIDLAIYNRLPDRQLEQEMLAAAATYYGISDAGLLAHAPGSQALIQWLPRLRPKSRVAVVGPTYQEHARCWELAGHCVENKTDFGAARTTTTDVVILVRPNNPTGDLPGVSEVAEAAAELATRGGWLIVDEAFADTCPEDDLRQLAGQPGLIILKSFGKFFGLAGLRLGIAISDEETNSLIRNAVGPWSVPGPTLEIAKQAYADKAWIKDTHQRLEADTSRLDKLLTDCGCSVIGGTSLFRLVELDLAQHLLRHLGDRGILLRHFSYNRTWLRFGLPDCSGAWQRLEEALSSFKPL